MLVDKINSVYWGSNSTELDSMGIDDSTKISFQVKAFDGTDYSNEVTVSVNVNGNNDAPIITVENPVLSSLNEIDFKTLFEDFPNGYYVISEKEVFDSLGVTDVDLTDGLSVSLVENSSVFELNGTNVTSSNNGIIQLTAQDIIDYDLTGKANVGDFFVYSTELDSMGIDDSTKISFQVKAFDGTDYSNEVTVSVNVNGNNDAPIITVENPVLSSLNEIDFKTLFEDFPNGYYVISEKEVFDSLGVTDVDLTDGLSVSLVENSSVFELNGTNVTSSNNGIIQLTAQDIIDYDLTGKANVGDFFVYSTELDSMGIDDSTKISFQVKAFDGTDYSNEVTVSVNVNGNNDAPIITVENPVLSSLNEIDFKTLFEDFPNGYYVISEKEVFDSLGVTDVDLTDGLSVSLVENSSVFELNGTNVTSSNNGIIQLTAQDIIDYDLTGKANVGDFFVYSTELDSMGIDDSTKISFQVKAFDGTDYSNEVTVSVNVNGNNDAPIITVENPVLSSLNEIDFKTLFEDFPNGYYVISEKEVFDSLGVTDVDLTDGLSVSLVENSSVFELNGTNVTSSNNGIIQLTAQDIIDYDLTGKANVGDFFVYSTELDSMGIDDSTKISFQVKAFDGTDYSNEVTVSVNVNGNNDAPIITVENPVLSSLNEIDFKTLFEDFPNGYYVISEKEVFDSLGVTDVDLTDGLSVSLVENSSVFELNGTNVTSSNNGIIQLTAQDIIDYDLTGKANVGDFFVYSTELDSMGIDDSTKISFQVKAFDGTDYSNEVTVSVNVNGNNDALSGTSIDGYISGMTVFSDTNANNLLDEEEANTLTNEVGEFTLTGTLTGITIGEGGVDISTNVEFEGQYKAPSGVSVLNPITTLIVNLVNEGVSQEEAETLIYQSLGLDSNISLFDDPIENSINASTQEETSNYISLQVVNVMIENTVSQIAATISAGNISDEKTAYIMASKELAKLLLSDETIDLLNSNDLRTIIENTLTSLEYTITSEDSTVVSNLVEIIMNINNSMKESTTEFLNAQEALTNLAKIQIVSEEIENDIEINISEEDGDLLIIKEINSVESIMVASEDVEVGFITKEQALNHAPETSEIYSLIQNDNSIKEYTGQLKATDVDLNDTLTYSVDSSSVNVSLTISNLNGLSTLVALNNPVVESALLSLKPVITNFINTGDLSGFLTLNPQTIMTTKAIVGTLQEFLNVNSDLKDSIVLLKDFIIANKDEIIANTNLVAQDIVILQSLLTQENLIALENLYHSVNSFLDANPQIKELATTILADNIISPSELVTLNPILLAQIEGLRVQLKSIVDSNSTVLDLISINEVIAKLQEVITVDAVNQEVSIKTTVPETLANMIVTLDENTGEYTINNAFAEKFSSLGDLEISFDYKVIDSEGAESNISSASILITTEDVEEMTTSLDEEGMISFDNENIDLATILDNISSNIEIEDIDSIDLSNAEHILSNLTIEDFEAMVSDDSSNTLAINGENNDIIKLDLSIWSKEESDKDNNSEVENEDDGYITYTATGTTEQTLTLLIDKDITVENI